MPSHRSTEARRKASAGLVCIRIGAKVYWVPTEVARRVEQMAIKARTEGENISPEPEARKYRIDDWNQRGN